MVLVLVHRFPNKQNHPNAICPYQSPSYFSTQSHTNKITPHTQSTPNEITHSTRNLPKRHQPPTCNPSKRNRRGGACGPARTFAQRRFHAKNTRIVRGGRTTNAPLWGRHGWAHRHRPYQSPSNHTVWHYLITLYIR